MNVYDDYVVLQDGGQHLKYKMVSKFSNSLHLIQVGIGGSILKASHLISQIHTAAAVLFLELHLQTVDHHLSRKHSVLGVVRLSLKHGASRMKIIVAVKNTVKETVSVPGSDFLSLGPAESKTIHS